MREMWRVTIHRAKQGVPETEYIDLWCRDDAEIVQHWLRTTTTEVEPGLERIELDETAMSP